MSIIIIYTSLFNNSSIIYNNAIKVIIKMTSVYKERIDEDIVNKNESINDIASS